MRLWSRFNCQVIIVLSQHYVNDTLAFSPTCGMHLALVLCYFVSVGMGGGRGVMAGRC